MSPWAWLKVGGGACMDHRDTKCIQCAWLRWKPGVWVGWIACCMAQLHHFKYDIPPIATSQSSHWEQPRFLTLRSDPSPVPIRQLLIRIVGNTLFYGSEPRDESRRMLCAHSTQSARTPAYILCPLHDPSARRLRCRQLSTHQLAKCVFSMLRINNWTDPLLWEYLSANSSLDVKLQIPPRLMAYNLSKFHHGQLGLSTW